MNRCPLKHHSDSPCESSSSNPVCVGMRYNSLIQIISLQFRSEVYTRAIILAGIHPVAYTHPHKPHHGVNNGSRPNILPKRLSYNSLCGASRRPLHQSMSFNTHYKCPSQKYTWPCSTSYNRRVTLYRTSYLIISNMKVHPTN